MTLEQRKQVVKKMIDDADEGTILEIEQFLNPITWDNLTKDQKKSIEEGIKQAQNGEFVEHEEVKKKFGSWLTL